MKRLLLFLFFIVCIKIYSQESIIVDSVAPPSYMDVDNSIYYDNDNDHCDFPDEFPFNSLDTKMGGALSFSKVTFFDKNLFNMGDKIRLEPGYSYSVMISSTNRAYSAALDFKGSYQSIKFINVPSDYYDFFLLSIGLRLRKNFGSGNSYPYLLGTLYFNQGNFFYYEDEEPLKFKTYTAGLGAGYNFFLTGQSSVAVEGSYETGFGWWEEKPFDNSSGSYVNPTNINFRIILGINF